MTRRILVTGSRNWTDREAIRFALLETTRAFGLDFVLVHGDCPTGADAIAAEIWQDMGGKCEAHPANWVKYGRAAGPIRNQQMVDLGADACLAFPMGDSRGTRGCMCMAAVAGIPVTNFGDKEQS